MNSVSLVKINNVARSDFVEYGTPRIETRRMEWVFTIENAITTLTYHETYCLSTNHLLQSQLKSLSNNATFGNPYYVKWRYFVVIARSTSRYPDSLAGIDPPAYGIFWSVPLVTTADFHEAIFFLYLTYLSSERYVYYNEIAHINNWKAKTTGSYC